MENGSLANVIKKFGILTEALAAIYIAQVLRGLKYLHDQGVLHRDIKGANILTSKDGLVNLRKFKRYFLTTPCVIGCGERVVWNVGE